uniref:Adenosine deaminase n=1 Tax=Trichinella spiralis TaxID=6334 RepID=Q6IWY7_TRISP|nr:adenosine deaminase [Trichinella spiralis]
MKNFPKVELHVHLDGAIRHSTIVDIAKQKNIGLPSMEVEKLREFVVTQEPMSLDRMLKDFEIFTPVLIGDPDAIERVAYEFCETQKKNNVLYTEVRYSPHLLSNTAKNSYWPDVGPYKGKGEVTPEKVVMAVNEGLRKGQRDFGIQVRSLLCCIVCYPSWSEEVVHMCEKFKKDGVVGIDQAGYVHFPHEAKIFQMAKSRGIHRTVHAGEVGTADNVKQAIEQLQVERIGHGYRVLQDESIYELAKNGGYHFELCPLSSVVSGSVVSDWSTHPARRFLKDQLNFSINTDDPTILDNSMCSEFEICKEKLGFTETDLHVATCNAARSSFLEIDEKEQLLSNIKKQWF